MRAIAKPTAILKKYSFFILQFLSALGRLKVKSIQCFVILVSRQNNLLEIIPSWDEWGSEDPRKVMFILEKVGQPTVFICEEIGFFDLVAVSCCLAEFYGIG